MEATANRPRDIDHEDFPEITRLLDLALEYASFTWNDTAYYLLVAAGAAAFTDRLTHQVINTARFLGTNAYFTDKLDMGGADKYPRDFVELADALTRTAIEAKVWEAMQYAKFPPRVPTDEEMADFDEWRATQAEEMERMRPQWEADRKAAFDAAIAYRNHRARDDS